MNSISPSLEQQVMWPVNGHEEFPLRGGKLPEFQRFTTTANAFASQPKNTQYTTAYGQVNEF